MSARARLALVVIVLALVALAGAVWLIRRGGAERGASPPAAREPVPLESLRRAKGWLGGPFAVDSLAGHPTLIVVWSDTDPVSLAALPEADAWQRAYGRFGLRVVSVHMPEYAFAADSSVPAHIARRLGLGLPVALDDGLEISTRLGVSDPLPFWVLADRDGNLAFRARGDRIAAVEAAIQDLMRREHPEAGLAVAAPAPEPEPPPVRRVFCGTSRAVSGPLAHAAPGHTETYTAQFRYQEEGEAYTPYPVGRWTPTAEGVTSARGGAADYLSIRYDDAGAVDGVMGADGDAIRVWVLCDEGWLPESLRGDDIHANARGATYLEVSDTRLYSIARAGDHHVLKLSPEKAGVTIHELAFLPR